MSDENKQHQEDEHKEVSSTQTTDEQPTGTADRQPQSKEKVITPLPTTTVKPSSGFKLFSYNGDNSKAKIMNWIRMYENLAARSGWTDEEMKWNLASYLEQEAFDFYVEHVLSKNLEWSEAKQSLLKRFDQFEIEPFMEFLSHKWTPQLELKEYFKKMRALGVAAGLKEEDILSGLTRGLPVHLRSELSFVTSLQQWVAVAFCLQQRLEDNHGHYNKNQSWKGRRNSRNNRQNKPRNNHQQTLQSEHQLQNATSSNDHHDA